MSIKSRGIAIVLAALIVIVAHLARSAEVDYAITAQPTAFVRAIVEANPQVNAARAALDASVALQGAASRPLYNPSLEFEAENADSDSRSIGAEERYRLSQDAWRDWENTGGVSLERQSDLLQRLWESGELSTTDFLVQIRQTLDTRESALELRQAMWRAWFEWLAASGQIEDWLGIKHEL